MSESPENLVLVYLRRMDANIQRLVEDVDDLKRRVTSLEGGLASIHMDFAGQSARLDRIEQRLTRIERQLELAPAE